MEKNYNMIRNIKHLEQILILPSNWSISIGSFSCVSCFSVDEKLEGLPCSINKKNNVNAC